MPDNARIVSAPVAAPAQAVYDFASQMHNLPRWAAGLVTNVREAEGAWITDTPGGPLRIAMAARNALGVLDHDVSTPNGVTTHNAMRVTPVGAHSLVSFVVLRQAGATDAAFDKDAGLVAADLALLATLVEQARTDR